MSQPHAAPLFRRRIVVTRAAAQAEPLVAALSDRGAEAVRYPCLAIAEPEDSGPWDAVVRSLLEACFDRLVLTSATTVHALRKAARRLGAELSSVRAPVAAVGPKTAEVARVAGLRVDLVPPVFVAESLLEALGDVRDQRVLLPQGDLARPFLREELVARGAHVEAPIAYRTTLGHGGVNLAARLEAGTIDAVTLLSGSAATNLVARLDQESPEVRAAKRLQGTPLVSIGPETTKAGEAAGLTIAATADPHTIEGLCEALAKALMRRKDTR
ncbi:MAG: uroporphyrinogen-III synthase [Planctomycetota bacterium]|jgi:uroporphyrinogen III methyltransferase/synthase